MIHAREDYNRIQDPAGKIPVDEPVFMVRAKDPLAADVMRFWAKRHREEFIRLAPEGVNEITDQMADMVEAHADLADAWPIKNEIADIPQA